MSGFGGTVSMGRLGFGCATLGNLFRPMSDAEAQDTLDAARSVGIDYFDTAPFYGFGLSERRLGRFLACTARRDEFLLSTKVGRVLRPLSGPLAETLRSGFASAEPYEAHYDYSYAGVLKSFCGSLERLDVGTIDVAFAHDLGIATHGADHDFHFRTFMAGGYRALLDLRAEGRLRYIGLGVNEWEVCVEALNAGDFDVVLLAGRYTLLDQSALSTLLPLCLQRGVKVVIGGPYNSGILATGVRGGGRPNYDYGPAPDAVIDRVAAMERVCDQFEVPLAAAALQFPLAHPAVACVIPGLASPREVRMSSAWASCAIPTEFWATLRHDGLIDPSAPLPLV